jgi:hypothetical protein
MPNRDYPLSPTPKPKIDVYLEGLGSNKNYNVNASVNVPIYKGLSVGVSKNLSKDDYGKYSGTSYNASLKIPIRRRKKKD